MNKITFGMVGLGAISHRFVKGSKKVEGVKIIAAASRTLDKAKAYAETYDIPYAYASYDEMLKNPDIDAIYIATPNDTHASYMMKALQHGKHVLCEKPFTVHTAEAQSVFAYAKQQHLIVMEAMKACFMPATWMVKQWLQEDRIGKLLYMEAGYISKCADVPPTHHLFSKERGGGSFYDVGIYPLAFVNEIHPYPITSYTAEHVYQKDIDIFTQVLLHYEDDVVASVRSGIFKDMNNEAVLYGELGTICIPQFWKSERAYLRIDGKDEVIFEELHDKSEFQYQIRHFVNLLRQGAKESDIMSEAATLNNMRILEGVIFNQ